MADVKISDLTAATSVANTDLFEIESGAASKKATAAQLAANIIAQSQFVEQVQDIVGAMLVQAGSTVITYNDAGNTVTISSTDTVLSTEQVQDIVGALISAGANATVTYNDAANTLVIAATGGGGGGSSTTSDRYEVIDGGFAAGTYPAMSSSAFASKGVGFTPLEAITLNDATAYFTPVSGASYKMVVCTLSGLNITSIVATSEVRTMTTTTVGNHRFKFATPPTLAANTLHAILLVRTDGATTYILPLGGSIGAIRGIWRHAPIVSVDYSLRLASIDPQVGNTLDNGAAAVSTFIIGLGYTVPK